MRDITIKDIDGNVMYTGRAQSRKAFIEQLVSERRSLARANLVNANLSHLKLDKANFNGANLSGASLTGSSLKYASFEEANLRGITAGGIYAERASFKGADLSTRPAHTDESGMEWPEKSSNLAVSRMPYANFDGARLDGVDFTDATMSSATMVGASVRKAKFTRSIMHNVDWAHATVTHSNFDDANMEPTLLANSEQHLPDRTIGSAIFGNSLVGTQVGVGNSAFRGDQRLGKAAKVGNWVTVTGTALYLTSWIPMNADADYISHLMGQGLGFLAVSGGMNVLKERIVDTVKDRFADLTEKGSMSLRSFLNDLMRRGVALGSLAVAVVSSGHARALVDALRLSGEESGFVRLGSVMGGRAEVVVCTRKRLARALTRLSETLHARGTPQSDIVLVRPGTANTEAPRAIVHGADGTVAAVWRNELGERSYIKWDADGNIIEGTQDHPTRGRSSAMRDCFRDFSSALLSENDIPDMGHDDETHMIRTGRDGSVVVVRKGTGTIDNRGSVTVTGPDGTPNVMKRPAILTPDGTRLYFRNGSHIGHEAESKGRTATRGPDRPARSVETATYQEPDSSWNHLMSMPIGR